MDLFERADKFKKELESAKREVSRLKQIVRDLKYDYDVYKIEYTRRNTQKKIVETTIYGTLELARAAVSMYNAWSHQDVTIVPIKASTLDDCQLRRVLYDDDYSSSDEDEED